jgi:hypothetical protein
LAISSAYLTGHDPFSYSRPATVKIGIAHLSPRYRRILKAFTDGDMQIVAP